MESLNNRTGKRYSNFVKKSNMNYTSNDLIEDIKMGERIDEIVVRVGTVEEPKKFGEGKFIIFKFFVENEKALRIQCIVMEDQIGRVKPLVKKNSIICIKGATSKRETNPKYNCGDVPFVLMIYANTTITVIKDYNPDEGVEDEATYDLKNEPKRSSLSALLTKFALEDVVTSINENTAAMKELTATLKGTRRNF